MKKTPIGRRRACVLFITGAFVAFAAGVSTAGAQAAGIESANVYAHGKDLVGGGGKRLTLTVRALRMQDNVIDESRTQKVYWEGTIKNPCGGTEYVDAWLPTQAVVTEVPFWVLGRRTYPQYRGLFALKFEMYTTLSSYCSGSLRTYPLRMWGSMHATGVLESDSPGHYEFADQDGEIMEVQMSWSENQLLAPQIYRSSGEGIFSHSTRI